MIEIIISVALILFIVAIITKKIHVQYSLVFLSKGLLIIFLLSEHSVYMASMYAILTILSGLLILMATSKLSRDNSGNRYGSTHLRNQLLGFLSVSLIIGIMLVFIFKNETSITNDTSTYLEAHTVMRTFLAVPKETKVVTVTLLGVLAIFVSGFIKSEPR